MAGDGLEVLPEMEQLEGNVAKDLFAGAVGGIAQVFVGESSRPGVIHAYKNTKKHWRIIERHAMVNGEKQEMYRCCFWKKNQGNDGDSTVFVKNSCCTNCESMSGNIIVGGSLSTQHLPVYAGELWLTGPVIS